MYQFLLQLFRSGDYHRGKKKRACASPKNAALAPTLLRLASVAWGAVATCALAVDAHVEIPQGTNPLVQAYRVQQAEMKSPHSGNRFALIERVAEIPEAPFFTASESTQCRAKPYRFCRDFSQSEFRITSLRFMVPEVRGLSPKSLTIRRNSVIANYTFR